jgi:hypothetical protein
MPWKECHAVDERTRFVRRLLEGEAMTALCQEFGILRLIRFRGHVPKGGYDVPNGFPYERSAASPALH